MINVRFEDSQTGSHMAQFGVMEELGHLLIKLIRSHKDATDQSKAEDALQAEKDATAKAAATRPKAAAKAKPKRKKPVSKTPMVDSLKKAFKPVKPKKK
jgi:hypothetical protein